MAGQRHTKVAKFQILKPAADMRWSELGRLLRDAQYRVYRLANLALSEKYLRFHLFRTGQTESLPECRIGRLNRQLRQMLKDEGGADDSVLDRFSRTGALPDTVVGALWQYRLHALTKGEKWNKVTRGETALPTFRRSMALPIRCDKRIHHRLERAALDSVELDLMICTRPYPRVILKTAKLDDGAAAILERLLDNEGQLLEGYRQRCFEVRYAEDEKAWWLHVTYDSPATPAPHLSKDIIVGVDLGFSCPMYVALSNGDARLGRRQFAALAARIRSLQTQVMARRRQMLSGGKASLSGDTARSGHGRKRKLLPIESLEGRINRAYTTLNHQLSISVVHFAVHHGAGVIQIENLEGLQNELTGTFLGQRWRYHQLQEFLNYKANEAGIEVRRVNPRYTSRRCSKCGYIHVDFNRAFRDAARQEGKVARFCCPKCEYEAHPDYNAARNLATVDIEGIIKVQCERQGIDRPSVENQDEVAK